MTSPRRVCIAAALLVLAAAPAHARILKTRQVPSYRELALTLGSGFEYETDGEESEYGFPILVEYGITELLKVTVEPSYVLVRKKQGGSIHGPGDLETTLTLELPTERRYRPGFALEGGVKWPTAPRGDLGTGKADVTIGGLVSKEFVPFDLDLNASYTFVGEPADVELQDTFELSLACEYHLRPSLDLQFEAVTAGAAGDRPDGAPVAPGAAAAFANLGGPEQGQSESEFTLGLAEFLTPRFKLEQGAIMKSDGAWQLVVAWEFDFGEGR